MEKIAYEIEKPRGVSTIGVQQLAKELAEMAFNETHPANEKWKEYFGKVLGAAGIEAKEGFRAKESTLTITGSAGVFTTAIAAMIEKEFRPKLLAEGVIKKLPIDLKGHDSIQIPLGKNLTASEITDFTSAVPSDDQDYGELTISTKWVGLQTSLTHRLLTYGVVDLLADKFEETGAAVGRKVDADIIAELIKAATKGDATYGDNSNYTYCGSGTTVSYDTLVDAIEGMEGLNATAKAIVTNPTSAANLLKDSDIKGALAFGTTPSGNILPSIQNIFDKKLLVSSQVPANKIILVDTDKAKYFLDASPIETWDGRLPTKLAFEIIGAKCYGVGITRPQAVWVIHENAAEPT